MSRVDIRERSSSGRGNSLGLDSPKSTYNSQEVSMEGRREGKRMEGRRRERA